VKTNGQHTLPANAVVKHCNLDVAVTGFDASLVVHKHTHTHKLFIKQCNLLLFNGGHVVQLGKTDLAQLALLFVFFCNFSGLPHFEAQGLFLCHMRTSLCVSGVWDLTIVTSTFV